MLKKAPLHNTRHGNVELPSFKKVVLVPNRREFRSHSRFGNTLLHVHLTASISEFLFLHLNSPMFFSPLHITALALIHKHAANAPPIYQASGSWECQNHEEAVSAQGQSLWHVPLSARSELRSHPLAEQAIMDVTIRSCVPQCRWCFETECEASFGSFKAWRRTCCDTTDKWRQCPDRKSQNQCPACRAIYRDRNAARRHLLSSIRRGFVVIDPVILVKFTFHPLSVVLSATLNLETGLICSNIWLSTFVTFS